MASTSLIKALGLNVSINALEAPQGTLYEASNVIIRRDDVIESRRGYDLFGVSFGTSTERCKQLAEYKTRIIRHYSDKLQFEDELNNAGEMNFKTFSGSYLDALSGYRFKFIESNGNFYFTSSEGIKKISARTAADLSTDVGFITQAGGIKALDLSGNLNLVQGEIGGFLPQDSVVGYKIVWGLKDANNNLVLGTPSDSVTVYNFLSNYLILDFNKLLNTLDVLNQTGSLITDGNYTQTLLLSQSSDANAIKDNFTALSTKLDKDLVFADSLSGSYPLVVSTVSTTSGVIRINFSSGNPSNYFNVGDKIYLSNFKSGSPLVDIDEINKNQTISNIQSSYLEFTPAAYDQATPSGISGSLTNPAISSSTILPTTLILTCAGHGLKTNQTISITGSNANVTPARPSGPSGIDGDYEVTVLTENTFSIQLISGATNTQAAPRYTSPITALSAGTASWNIKVNGVSSSNIQSYTFRAIESPEQPSIPTTNAQLTSLQTYLETIISELQNLKDAVISSPLKTAYLTSFSLTQNSNVSLTITIPSDVIENVHFYQVYRTDIITATSTDVLADYTPIQEYRQIEESFPSTTDISLGYLIFEDSTPQTTALVGAPLYTNERSREGALQSNDVPPFATDINRFKNYIFYSNTKTRHRKTLNLLGTADMISSYNPSNQPKIIFSNSDSDQEVYTFVKGVQQQTTIVCPAASVFAISGSASYFLINSPYNRTRYYIWYSVIGSSMTDPAPANTDVGIKVVVNPGDSNAIVAQKTTNAVNSLSFDFTCSVLSNTVTILADEYGAATAASQPVVLFGITTIPGDGEDASSQKVLLSDGGGSVSLAIEETAKSLVRVIDRNSNGTINAFYISGTTIGTILFESRSLNTPKFYVLGNNSTTGGSFYPDISPKFTISSISTSGAPTTIQTSSPHGLISEDQVVILNAQSTSDNIDGLQTVVSVLSTTQFTINKNVTAHGANAVLSPASVAEYSDNEEQRHRVYYSKLQEPEAVPILNFIDVGANDKSILRIFPLRDSLFVFKEDGLYRISGEVAPFTLALFDSSCILLASDSLDVSNNQIYGWTTQGISIITESGVNIISRPIDIDVLKIATYPNFKTATWGIGYESDTSYTVYTTNDPIDINATIGYRYSSLTSTWTTIDKTAISGLNKSTDDLLYLSPGDANFIEKERKTFTRYDYADRELDFSLVDNAYSNGTVKLPAVSNISIGDVLLQTQQLTIYEFNALLEKLDIDPGVPSSNYYSTLAAINGDNLRNKLELLAIKLDSDSLQLSGTYASSIGSYTKTITSVSAETPPVVTTSTTHSLLSNRFIQISGVSNQTKANGDFLITVTSPNTFTIPIASRITGTGGNLVTLVDTFEDLKGCYNIIISMLNTDSIVAYANYSEIDNETQQEAIVIGVNPILNTIQLNLDLAYIVGPISIFKAISCSVVYNPNLMGDPLSFKHIREATMMFANKAFTSASLSFSTDLLPEFISVPFNGDGSGIFGHQTFGSHFFGGASNSAPFRTYIPRQCQRCRYINVGFNHTIAREQFGIYGLTLTGETGISSRAYR